MDGRTYHHGSIESYQNFGGAIGQDHNYGISAHETVLSPAVLSREVVEESKLWSAGEKLSLEQVEKEAAGNFISKQPSLVTTLNPYNYGIDLPFKQKPSFAIET